MVGEDNWYDLASAIVAKAVDDYVNLKLYGRVLGCHTTKKENTLEDVTSFFKSQYCEILTNLSYSSIMNIVNLKIKKIKEEEANDKKNEKTKNIKRRRKTRVRPE